MIPEKLREHLLHRIWCCNLTFVIHCYNLHIIMAFDPGVPNVNDKAGGYDPEMFVDKDEAREYTCALYVRRNLYIANGPHGVTCFAI